MAATVDDFAAYKRCLGLLGKLTYDNFDRVGVAIVETASTDCETYTRTIIKVVELASHSAAFTSVYAKVLVLLGGAYETILEPYIDDVPTYGEYVLSLIVDIMNECEPILSNNEKKVLSFSSDLPDGTVRASTRLRACLLLIASLFVEEVLEPHTIHATMLTLLDRLVRTILRSRSTLTAASTLGYSYEQSLTQIDSAVRDHGVSCLQFFGCVGKKLDVSYGRVWVDEYLKRLQSISPALSPQLRFMVADIVERRDDGWTEKRMEMRPSGRMSPRPVGVGS